jgi:hypothetical protein
MINLEHFIIAMASWCIALYVIIDLGKWGK